MTAIKLKIGVNGRLIIPARFRRQAGLTDGGSVLLEASKGEIRIRPIEDAIERPSKKLKTSVKGSASIADALIAERRLKAKRDPS